MSFVFGIDLCIVKFFNNFDEIQLRYKYGRCIMLDNNVTFPVIFDQNIGMTINYNMGSLTTQVPSMAPNNIYQYQEI